MTARNSVQPARPEIPPAGRARAGSRATTGVGVAAVEFTWAVTRRSLGAHAPPGAGRLVDLTVRVDALDGPDPSPSAWLRDGAHTVTLALPAHAALVLTRDASGFHLDCPGVLHATVARSRGVHRLAYARTALTDRLGVPGGRVEPARLRVEQR